MFLQKISVSPARIIGMSKTFATSKTPLRICPNFRLEADFYDIKLGRQILGNSTFRISKGETLKPVEIVQFPDTWLTASKNQPLKPFLYIAYIELLQEKGKGWARKTMQLLHALSKKQGCEGRIALRSTPTTKRFYSHLGFDCPPKDKEMYDKLYAMVSRIAEAKNLKKQEFSKELREIGCPTKTNGKYNTTGLRFFIPTPDNLAKLYKNS